MRTVLDAALAIQEFLASRDRSFCIIGGIALQRWGEQRATRDVDLTLMCPMGGEPAMIDELLSAFPGRLPDAREFAIHNRVLLLRAGDVGLDISLGALDYERRCVERSSLWPILEGRPLRTCSAEDLVVLKSFAGRARDWLDVESVIVRLGPRLDWDLVVRELEPLLEVRGSLEPLDELRRLRERSERE